MRQRNALIQSQIEKLQNEAQRSDGTEAIAYRTAMSMERSAAEMRVKRKYNTDDEDSLLRTQLNPSVISLMLAAEDLNDDDDHQSKSSRKKSKKEKKKSKSSSKEHSRDKKKSKREK